MVGAGTMRKGLLGVRRCRTRKKKSNTFRDAAKGRKRREKYIAFFLFLPPVSYQCFPLTELPWKPTGMEMSFTGAGHCCVVENRAGKH